MTPLDYFPHLYIILCAIGCVITTLKIRRLNRSIARSVEYLKAEPFVKLWEEK